jgi:hypothetical protein
MKFINKIFFSGLFLIFLNACQTAVKPEAEHELNPLSNTGQIDCTKASQSACKSVDKRVLAP